MKRLIILCMFIALCFRPTQIFAEDENGSVLDAYEQSPISNEVTEDTPAQNILDSPDDENEANSDAPALFQNESDISLFNLVLRFVLALVLVVVLIYVLLKFMNKYTAKQGQLSQLENLGGISVGLNKSVQLVKVGNTVYLLGVGDNVDLLTEVKDEALIEQIMNNRQAPTSDLLSKVTQVWGQQKTRNTDKTQNTQQQKSSDASFASLFKGELDQMKQKQSKIRRNIEGHDQDE